MTYQCMFEQNPVHPRCERTATHYLETKDTDGKRRKDKYCGQHVGYVIQQLKGTYIKVLSWGKLGAKPEGK